MAASASCTRPSPRWTHLNIVDQPLASIAKREEILYVAGREDEPVILDRRSPVLKVIQQIRDESHRFAITFHRARRAKRHLTSELSDIAGVGPRTRQRLLSHFGSLAKIRDGFRRSNWRKS